MVQFHHIPANGEREMFALPLVVQRHCRILVHLGRPGNRLPAICALLKINVNVTTLTMKRKGIVGSKRLSFHQDWRKSHPSKLVKQPVHQAVHLPVFSLQPHHIRQPFQSLAPITLPLIEPSERVRHDPNQTLLLGERIHLTPIHITDIAGSLPIIP